MIDISFAGGTVAVKMANGETATISEFSADENPVTVERITVANGEATLNGQAVFWRAPNLFTISIAVIPQSRADTQLGSLLHNAHIQPGNIAPIRDLTVDSITISAPLINASGSQQSSAKNVWTFTKGRITEGDPAITSAPDGKMQAKTYTFMMEKMSAPGKNTGLEAASVQQ